MAKIEFSGFEKIEKQLLHRSERAVKAVPKMLTAGASVLVETQAAEINSAFKGKRSTGALAKSIKATKVTGNEIQKSVDVYPRGKDKSGVSNATKGFFLQYGRKNMPARPWMTAANEKAKDKVRAAMLKEWEEQDG